MTPPTPTPETYAGCTPALARLPDTVVTSRKCQKQSITTASGCLSCAKKRFCRGSIGHHGAEYIQHTASHRTAPHCIASHHIASLQVKNREGNRVRFPRGTHTRKHRAAHTRHTTFFSEWHMHTAMRLRFCYIQSLLLKHDLLQKRTCHTKDDLIGCFQNTAA